MTDISRRSMLAGVGGVGALAIGLGSAEGAAAEPPSDVSTEEWLLGTRGAVSELGGLAPSIRDGISASPS